jgi:hypothetical protein
MHNCVFVFPVFLISFNAVCHGATQWGNETETGPMMQRGSCTLRFLPSTKRGEMEIAAVYAMDEGAV